ncbi:MAG TPA: type II toxin-antitoxin system HicA family toxin [Vicinamibacterales bacterium]|nr:type II toxin-antitoxin system HicA family toxin [Vicinamibacterales bacterium]
MGALPTLKPREVVALLVALGFTEVRQKGSHKQFRHIDGRGTTVPVHSGRGELHPPAAVRVRTATGPATAHAAGSVIVACAAGERATGGGGHTSGLPGFILTQSVPYPQLTDGETPTGWFVSFDNTTGQDRFVIGIAICVTP